MPNFEVLICLKSLDSSFLPQMISSVKKFIKPTKITIITHKSTIEGVGESLKNEVEFLDENKIYRGLSAESVGEKLINLGTKSKSRAGWYLQQFLKMSYATFLAIGGGQKHYLIWDADAFPLRPLTFFDENGKVLVEIATEYHKPYFKTMQNLGLKVGQKPFGKVADFSFIAENLMIDAPKMRELIELIEAMHKKPFWEAILEAIDAQDLEQSGFSEFETYGTFLALKYPREFCLITRKRDRFAKQIIGTNPSEAILRWYGRDYEVCGIESWDTPQTRLNAWLLKFRFIRILSPKMYKKAHKICVKMAKILRF